MVDPILALPHEAKDRIFTYLDGNSLHKARQVCQSWNEYILIYIWGVRLNRNILSHRVERNWQSASNYTFGNDEYHDVTMSGFIPPNGKSSKYVAIRSYYGVILENCRIQLFNLENKSTWEIPNLFDTVFHKAKYNNFRLALTDSLLIVRVDAKSPIPTQTLLVWDIESEMKIYDVDIRNLKAVEVNKTWTNSKLFVLFTKRYIELWDCSDIFEIVRTRIGNNNSQFFTGHYYHPFVTLMQYHPAGDRNEIKVCMLYQIIVV